jgi:hypothetical protein
MRSAILVTAAVVASATVAPPKWKIVAPNVVDQVEGISFSSATLGFIVGTLDGVSGVFKSVDGGVTWRKSSDPTGFLYSDVSSYGDKHAFTSKHLGL